MTILTVNVVELLKEKVVALYSFEDNEDGMKEAIDLFTRIILNNGAEQEDLQFHIEEGCFKFLEDGEYKVQLVHSQTAI